MNGFMVMVLALLCLAHARTIFTTTKIHPVDSFAISCGSSSRMVARDGRTWLEDIDSSSSSSHALSGISMTTTALAAHQTAILVDPTPYNKARISRHEFAFTFIVPPGQKFVRLHFFVAPYKGFEKFTPIFSVKAGKFTLLTNFSPAIETDPSAEKVIVKEFCVSIKEHEALDLVFTPFVQTTSEDIYAFINGIEIVSMPAGLYFTSEGDLGAEVVGHMYNFYVDNDTALEMVKRVNIGGNAIPSVEDESMFRGWDSDLDSHTHTGSVLINRNVKIQYKGGSAYVAPMKVYQSAKITSPKNQLNKHNLTWRISVDSGFGYLIRLHFCELEPAIMKAGDREFGIVINNEIAESNADLIKWGGGQKVALHRDFVVILEGNPNRSEHTLVITLEPKFRSNGIQTDAILNGLEIFKMSNPDNHLASRRVVRHIQSPTASWVPKQMRLPPFDRKNGIATILTVIITSLNIAVYYMRQWSQRSSDIECMSSQCHQFSLDEIRSSTNNFHQEYLIGKGGFGTVYKGRLGSYGDTLVAIKRLRAESSQGEKEFWAEIEMLSKLQDENLVSLVGYCNESQERLLVYQYMKRGTLDDHLYKISANRTFHRHLSWDRRLQISIGAAYGLWYLHEKQVIHRDVKSSNILIDENWVAKISDFGLSRMGPADESLLSYVSTDVKGTFGYLCPEYHQTRMLSFKTDVYAFGVVLLEVLTGRPPVDISLPDEQYSLAAWAQNCIRNGNVDGIIDPTLLRQIAPACLKKYVEIALSCLKRVPRERPSMFDVVRHLESALVSQRRLDDSKDVIEVGKTYNHERFDDSEDVIEIYKTYNHDKPSLDYTTTSAETIPPITKDDISRESVGHGGDSSSSGKDGLERDKWWDVLQYSQKKWWDVLQYSQKSHEFGNLSYDEILAATDNYRNSLDYYWGTVCKGQIVDQKRVVVLRNYMETRPTQRKLQSKLGLHSSRKQAPSALLGYCVHDHIVMLMFDEIDKANSSSLSVHLHEPGREPLSWKQRLMICIDAARVLKCLEAIEMQCMTFTSGDIYFDERFQTKIDLYKESEVNYAEEILKDSVHALSRSAINKAGVVSFGMILFEVLCPYIKSSSRDEFKMVPAIVLEFTMQRKKKKYTRHFDPYLIGKISPKSSNVFLEIASRCVHSDGSKRPTMSKVVSQLEMALQLQEASSFT